MEGKIYSKSEIKNFTKDIKKLKLEGHKPERFKQVIYIKKKQDISEGIYLPYIISSYGRIFSLNYHMTGKIHEISPAINKDGYLHLILYNKGEKYAVRIHRLVCTAFKKNKDYKKYYEVNHKDSNRDKNYSWNLEWCTPKYNANYSMTKGNRKITYGEDTNGSKYTNKQIEKVCKLLVKGESYTKISKKTKVSYDTIVNILYKRQWRIVSDKFDFSNHPYWKNK